MSRVVDLTLPFDPRNPRVQFEPLKRIEVDGWTITKVTLIRSSPERAAPAARIRLSS